MNILFVCTANICRSVVAEAMMQRLLSAKNGGNAFVVESAGIDAVSGMRPDRITVELCTARGLEVGRHPARQLTKDMLAAANVVLCMEDQQKQRIAGAYPDMRRKVFLLKEYGKERLSDALSIEDPTGKSRKRYAACIEEIEKEVSRLVEVMGKKE